MNCEKNSSKITPKKSETERPQKVNVAIATAHCITYNCLAMLLVSLKEFGTFILSHLSHFGIKYI